MSSEPLMLWEHPLSPYAQKVKIALAEKGVDFVAKTPDAFASGAVADPFRKHSVRGEVPVLVADGRAIVDSTIILEFIEESFPSPALLSADPFERARARMIEDVCDTQFEAITWGLMEIVYFKRADGDRAQEIIATAGAQISRIYTWLERELAGREWFSGEMFGWADLSIIPYAHSATGFGFTPDAASPLLDWLARCRSRPSVSAAFDAARNAAAVMSTVAGVIESGGFKRQYRDHRLEWMIRSGGLDIVAKGLERGNIRFNIEPS